MHVESSGRAEVSVGDILASLMQQPQSHAAYLLTSQGVTRLDILNYISHGIAKVPMRDEPEMAPSTPEGEGASTPSDPLTAYPQNLTEPPPAANLAPLPAP